jgi:hypothetical protein
MKPLPPTSVGRLIFWTVSYLLIVYVIGFIGFIFGGGGDGFLLPFVMYVVLTLPASALTGILELVANRYPQSSATFGLIQSVCNMYGCFTPVVNVATFWLVMGIRSRRKAQLQK